MNTHSTDVRIYLMTDTMDGQPGWWTACADFNGTPAYDASAPTLEIAFARLAQVLAEALYDAELQLNSRQK